MIYIIRHGQTEMNNRRVLQGRSDYPLNETGIRQAKEAAASLQDVHFDYVFTSPLTRAVQTAQLVAPYAQPVIDERLIEMEYGPYEGTDLGNLPPEMVTFFKDFVNNPAPEGMEQLSEVVERAGRFVEDIRHLEGNILISTHAIAMKGILEYLTPGSNGAYWNIFVGNCGVYTAQNRGGEISVPKERK
ncbi:MAG: histidine phosphatase family protein [Lachnospiraceae bacterium]|nr:histidine phosphatase family protein [Lachnospiraceae bacterium]